MKKLGTKVKLQMLSIKKYDADWTMKNGALDEACANNANDIGDANLMSYLTANWVRSRYGVAYFATICSAWPGNRCNLSKYQSSVAAMAGVSFKNQNVCLLTKFR